MLSYKQKEQPVGQREIAITKNMGENPPHTPPLTKEKTFIPTTNKKKREERDWISKTCIRFCMTIRNQLDCSNGVKIHSCRQNAWCT